MQSREASRHEAYAMGRAEGSLWSRIADERLRPVGMEGNHGRVD